MIFISTISFSHFFNIWMKICSGFQRILHAYYLYLQASYFHRNVARYKIFIRLYFNLISRKINPNAETYETRILEITSYLKYIQHGLDFQLKHYTIKIYITASWNIIVSTCDRQVKITVLSLSQAIQHSG